jgi:hypothetical protein
MYCTPYILYFVPRLESGDGGDSRAFGSGKRDKGKEGTFKKCIDRKFNQSRVYECLNEANLKISHVPVEYVALCAILV